MWAMFLMLNVMMSPCPCTFLLKIKCPNIAHQGASSGVEYYHLRFIVTEIKLFSVLGLPPANSQPWTSLCLFFFFFFLIGILASERSYPHPRSGVACGRSYPTPKARGGSREEQPHIQGAVAAQVKEGLEELFHVQGQEGCQWGDTPRPR